MKAASAFLAALTACSSISVKYLGQSQSRNEILDASTLEKQRNRRRTSAAMRNAETALAKPRFKLFRERASEIYCRFETSVNIVQHRI